MFVIDDDVIASGNLSAFTFKSIADVVRAALPALQDVLDILYSFSPSPFHPSTKISAGESQEQDEPTLTVEIALGGWSYGGVVAIELCHALNSPSIQFHVRQADGSQIQVRVRATVIFAFDSPFFAGVRAGVGTTGGDGGGAVVNSRVSSSTECPDGACRTHTVLAPPY